MKEQALSQQAFERARALARQRFAQFREKHPTLQAYLVLSSPIGQVAHEATIDDILKEFPEMIMDGKAKEEFVRFSKSPKPKDPSPKKLEQWRRKNDELVSRLEKSFETHGFKLKCVQHPVTCNFSHHRGRFEKP